MNSETNLCGQKELKEKVLDAGLCTNCGACVNLCPYIATYKDQTILLDRCDKDEGRCYAYCPRTPTDLNVIEQKLFDPKDLTPELGPFKRIYMTRSADQQLRHLAQHGGTVTALIMLALMEGIIDVAIVAQDHGDFLPHGVVVRNPDEVIKYGKSKFVVSPILETFNTISRGEPAKIGVVATPCQALALAKMRLKPFLKDDNTIDQLRLVVGVFCGWALSWDKLKSLLQKKKIDEKSVIALDIPPSKYHSMEVHTVNGIIEISLDEVLPCIREACRSCHDMTAEFADISVGSARLPEGWKVAKSWNQVITRTELGSKLIQLAKDRALLEFRDVPEGNLEKLKKASMNKKRLK